MHSRMAPPRAPNTRSSSAGPPPSARSAADAAFGRWEDARVFLAVARASSLSAAARALGTDQSTVSRRLAALERTLGRALFERGPRGLLPTRHGTAMVAAAEEVERAMHTLVDTARRTEHEVAGRVRVTLTEGLAQHVVVPHVLPTLFAAHPGLAIELVATDEPQDLARQEADVALRFFRTPRGELVGRRAARLSLGVLAAKHEARALRGRSVATLPWIGYERPGFETPEAAFLVARGVPRPRLVCSSVESQIAAVRAGLGVALAPRLLATSFEDLAVLRVSEALPALEVFVVTRRAIRDVPRIAAVFDALVAGLARLDEAERQIP
jgi:DNA-binding transcriptional LysR family regulator